MGGQPYLLFDVLGGDQTLPGAIMAVNAAQPGDFQDQTQQGFGQFLQQVTGGRTDAAMVFYCASTQCWMSYNAALRAANLGYRNVLWYRGGLEAWSYAGLPTMPAGGGMMPNQGGGMMPNQGGMMPNQGGMMPNQGGGMMMTPMMPSTGN
jgi:rhodanese-related sulfurtransferase